MASSLFTASLLPPPGVLGERRRLDSASDTANPACRGRSALRRCVIFLSTRAFASVTFLAGRKFWLESPGLSNHNLFPYPPFPDAVGILNPLNFFSPFDFLRGNGTEVGGNLGAVVRVKEANAFLFIRFRRVCGLQTMSRACLQTHTPRAKDEISASLRSGQTSQEETAARLKRRRACLELGQRKEDFELLELLGQGSYARVYKARSRHSTRQVRSTTVYPTLPLHSSTHRMFLSYAPTQVCCL